MKSKKSDSFLLWIAILAVILIGGSFFLVYEIEKEGKTSTSTTTTTLGVTTTTEITTTTAPAIITTTTYRTTTTTQTTSTSTTSTTTTIRQKIKTCDDYCVRNGYMSGNCRTHPMACTIKGVNEVYSPGGNRYCPRGEIEDICCCVVK